MGSFVLLAGGFDVGPSRCKLAYGSASWRASAI